jgi:hypothetical protein
VQSSAKQTSCVLHNSAMINHKTCSKNVQQNILGRTHIVHFPWNAHLYTVRAAWTITQNVGFSLFFDNMYEITSVWLNRVRWSQKLHSKVVNTINLCYPVFVYKTNMQLAIINVLTGTERVITDNFRLNKGKTSTWTWRLYFRMEQGKRTFITTPVTGSQAVDIILLVLK